MSDQNTTSMNEIFKALVQRLIASGRDDAASAPTHAAIMIGGWDWFTDNGCDETGRPTWEQWMDPEVVRLLDASLDAHFLRGEPYPTVAAA